MNKSYKGINVNIMIMDDSTGKPPPGKGSDKDILYSRAVKAGKRIYYMDVKKNLKDDLFVAITESKKIQKHGVSDCMFEKHKVFLYKEDFDKFISNLSDVIEFIKEKNLGNEPNERQEENNV